MTARGVLVIVSSPSGAGKTTLTRRLLAEHPELTFSVSYTTRPMRTGEVADHDYHFIAPETFEAMVERGEFAESAIVHGNRYGTAQAPVERALAEGRDVIFDVDWQGGAALSARWPTDSLKIFILPPDLLVLAHRLRGRATDAPGVIEKRLAKAIEELEHYPEYQHLIVNDDLERAYGVLRALYLTRRLGAGTLGAGGHPPAVAAELAALAQLLAANAATDPLAHAKRLVGHPLDA